MDTLEQLTERLKSEKSVSKQILILKEIREFLLNEREKQ